MNPNLSPEEFKDIPSVVQGVADIESRTSGKPVRITPHGGGGSYTLHGPDSVVRENVDAALDAGRLDEAEAESAYRGALTMYPGTPDDPDGRGPFTPDQWGRGDLESVVLGFGGIDTREQPSGNPPGEEWAEEVPVSGGVRGSRAREAAERVHRTWRL